MAVRTGVCEKNLVLVPVPEYVLVPVSEYVLVPVSKYVLVSVSEYVLVPVSEFVLDTDTGMYSDTDTDTGSHFLFSSVSMYNFSIDRLNSVNLSESLAKNLSKDNLDLRGPQKSVKVTGKREKTELAPIKTKTLNLPADLYRQVPEIK